MPEPCLTDPKEYPDDEVLERYLAEVKPVWDSFLSFLEEDHPSFATEWRFYKDGNRWLFKVTKKKKTICWVSVSHGMFSTTCYFTDRVEEALRSSDLRKEYLEKFANAKIYGKIRPLTIEMRTPADLVMTKILIQIREKF
jgi:hypothetical protein